MPPVDFSYCMKELKLPFHVFRLERVRRQEVPENGVRNNYIEKGKRATIAMPSVVSPSSDVPNCNQCIIFMANHLY